MNTRTKSKLQKIWCQVSWIIFCRIQVIPHTAAPNLRMSPLTLTKIEKYNTAARSLRKSLRSDYEAQKKDILEKRKD